MTKVGSKLLYNIERWCTEDEKISDHDIVFVAHFVISAGSVAGSFLGANYWYDKKGFTV